jgi:hypothetical protein
MAIALLVELRKAVNIIPYLAGERYIPLIVKNVKIHVNRCPAGLDYYVSVFGAVVGSLIVL